MCIFQCSENMSEQASKMALETEERPCELWFSCNLFHFEASQVINYVTIESPNFSGWKNKNCSL